MSRLCLQIKHSQPLERQGYIYIYIWQGRYRQDKTHTCKGVWWYPLWSWGQKPSKAAWKRKRKAEKCLKKSPEVVVSTRSEPVAGPSYIHIEDTDDVWIDSDEEVDVIPWCVCEGREPPQYIRRRSGIGHNVMIWGMVCHIFTVFTFGIAHMLSVYYMVKHVNITWTSCKNVTLLNSLTV